MQTTLPLTNQMEHTCPVQLAEGTSRLSPRIEKYEAALLLLLGFAGFSVTIAVLYNVIRKYVFKDTHNLDTVFDAGGRVSLSLTAVTVTSQLLWPAAFLHFSTVLSKSGIGGCLWSTIAVVIDILLFPTLSLKLKTRAPGAKTFPQIAYARYGKVAHIVFCILALTANLVTTVNLLLAGKAAIQVLTKDVSVEFIMLVLAVLFGSYCMVGGLGTTFYISYFNTALTFLGVSVVIIEFDYLATPATMAVSSRDAMYDAMACIEGPDGNYENSLLSFRTRSGLITGIVLMFTATSISFCDQANWQSRIAAKPEQGVIGFIIAAFLWFVIPTSISFTTAMTYLSMSFQNGTHHLSQVDIDNGFITPYIMDVVLGRSGAYLLMTVLMMALMSTGSGEVMSISSIIVYDIYKTHIRPFRKNAEPTSCVLCLKDKARNLCQCPSVVGCLDCHADQTMRNNQETVYGFQYQCQTHGLYRHYEDTLFQYKSWCMVWIVILFVPLGLLVDVSGMNLYWAVMVGETLASPFLVPIFLTISWAKTTGKAVVTGGVSGFLASVSTMLVIGSTYDGGLSDFFVNTSQDYSVIGGLAAGLAVSSSLTIAISLCTTTVKTHQDELDEWAKTMSIDNPLNPYRELYAEELQEVNAGPVITSDTMAKIFRRAQKVSYIGGGLSIALFLVVIPAVALSSGVLSRGEFDTWLSVCQILCLVSTVFVVIFPPIEESIQIVRQLRQNKAKAALDTCSQPVGTVEKPIALDGTCTATLGKENVMLTHL